MTSWRSLRFAEVMTAVLLFVLGLAVLIATARMRIGFAADFEPRLFPYLVGWLLIGGGVALGLFATRSPASLTVDWPDGLAARRLATVLASIASYLVAIDVIGMPLATFLVVWFQVWFLGQYPRHIPVLLALAAAILVHVVFTVALGLTFPAGVFDR